MAKTTKLKIIFLLISIFLIDGKGMPAESRNILPPSQKETKEDLDEALAEAASRADTSAIKLSLDKVTELGLSNSLDIQIAQMDAYIDRTDLQDAESIFDTFLNAAGHYEHNRLAEASTIVGTDSTEKKFSAGLEKLLPTGTTVLIDIKNTNAKTDSSFATMNPYDEVEFEASLTQELGRNFFGLADRAEIKVTKIDIANSDFTSLDDIEGAIFKLQEAYWKLVLRYKDVEITEDMLERAVRLHKIYQDKFSLGLVEETDVLAMEALIKTRQAEVAIAVLSRETAKNELLFLLNQGDFSQNIICEDELGMVAYRVNLYESLKEAIANRRDYKRVQNDLKKNNIEVVVSKNALWPQIDLEATFTRNSLNTSRKEAWKNISTDSHDKYYFGFTFEIPLENNEARAELKRVKLEKKRHLLDLKRVERSILREINNMVNRINTYHSQVFLAESAVKINEKKVAQQIKRLNYGRSDSDTLIDYERDLIRSRLFLAQNLFNYRVALIEMQLAQNTLLDKYWKEPL